MTKGILVVLSEPADGKEQEYNDWYDTTHGPEIIALDGFTAYSRYKMAPAQPGSNEGMPGYCAVYEIDSDDLMGTVAGIGAAVAAGKVQMADVIKRDPAPTMILYEEVTARTEA